ncbi:DNA recombination protein RmuC [Granulicella sp. L46]|uniref:DNA recombination protein RmuC n=1 Tax=Granulicella sp. L46 TaxID=1641865 RepID=UPI00131C701B|nr:DNA recombination protein RmuC [Granulicella sp. L46]
MIPALIVLQLLTLVALIVLLVRRNATTAPPAEDPRLSQLLAADLPAQFTRLDARSQGLDQHLRAELSQLRTDTASSSTSLRTEVLTSMDTLGNTLHSKLETSRVGFAAQANESREALHSRLNELRTGQSEHLETLRKTVEDRLDKLNVTNAAKLEEMRITVDEKLHATLQTRLTESFGQVTDQLTKVHAGLGEMTKLSAGVDDLSRIFTNVKSRGTIGEVMLETLLKQMLAPSQFEKNAKPKVGSNEVVEFVVKLPTPNGEALLPIDSKFPREAWERLETAYQTGADLVSAGKAFETAIRNEGKKICEKYISPPRTTSFAIMFLPTEGLYAEVMRRDGLQTDIQQNCHVTIAGPSTLSAILNSFQMGFHMLQLQQKGDEVWKVLANAQKQFGNLGVLMTRMETQVNTVQNTIQEVGKRTRVINKALSDVSVDDAQSSLPVASNSGFDGLLPMIAASDDE